MVVQRWISGLFPLAFLSLLGLIGLYVTAFSGDLF